MLNRSPQTHQRAETGIWRNRCSGVREWSRWVDGNRVKQNGSRFWVHWIAATQAERRAWLDGEGPQVCGLMSGMARPVYQRLMCPHVIYLSHSEWIDSDNSSANIIHVLNFLTDVTLKNNDSVLSELHHFRGLLPWEVNFLLPHYHFLEHRPNHLYLKDGFEYDMS